MPILPHPDDTLMAELYAGTCKDLTKASTRVRAVKIDDACVCGFNNVYGLAITIALRCVHLLHIVFKIYLVFLQLSESSSLVNK